MADYSALRDLVASEPLTDSEFWRPVPESHLLTLSPRKPPELFAL